MHPLEKFHFCPVCGSKEFETNDFKSKRCQVCGFVYYANPGAATAAFILDEAQNLLVVRRGKEPAKGTLDLPGGFCDMEETVEEGMRREIAEETGLQVNQLQYLFSMPNLYEFSGMGIHTLDMNFLVSVAGIRPAVRAADDAAEAVWIPIKEVQPNDFGLTSIRKSVIRFLEGLQQEQTAAGWKNATKEELPTD